ncbi:MAG TPA: tRNA lysidine(34) synthetase TilS, partial [Gemmatimonadaceae bacterium]
AFLHTVADAQRARVATAHSRDDQVETVLMRVLRGSGARGLAGLYAESAVVRPLLSVDRGTIRAFAELSGVEFVDDPTNESRRFLRNRIRLDLLPALRGVCPEMDAQLLDVSRRAAQVRGALDEWARELSFVSEAGMVAVAASQLAGYSRESLGALWQAVAAQVGLALDRRGTERIAVFTIEGRVAGRVQLSGGWEAYRERDRVELRRATNGIPKALALGGVRPIQVGAWRFSPGSVRAEDLWTAALPADMALVVRPWQAGDRMVAAGTTRPRRVKRFLSDAHVSGRHRSRWPVVVSNGVVVWIPGVRRSDAATARPGRSEVSYTCEFDDRR